jgi:hypothetical protein
MTIGYRQYPPHAHLEGYRARLALACGIGLMLGAGPAPAQDGFCSTTATALLRACRSEVKDDFFVAQAICINVSDDEGRRGCSGRARTARKEANKLCRRQRQGRLDACRSLGEGRYDPDFDPALYDDPRNPSNPNPFFPLRVGNRWEYGGAETVIVQVLNETKAIDGVRCIVVRDRVFEDGDLIEDTDDWFATSKDGDVWYCGEEVKDFESFAGDRRGCRSSSASTAPSRPGVTATSRASSSAPPRQRARCTSKSSRSVMPRTWLRCCPRPTGSAPIPRSMKACHGHSRNACVPATAW